MCFSKALASFAAITVHRVDERRKGALSLNAGLKVKDLLGLGLLLEHLLQRRAPVRGLVRVRDAYIEDTAPSPCFQNLWTRTLP